MVRGSLFQVALILPVVLSLAICPVPVLGQEAASDVPSITIRTSTRLVVVDVVVTDRKDQAISGLKPEDFTIEENGKKQKISFFLPAGSGNKVAPVAPPPGIISNRPENVSPAGFPLVLVIDALNSLFTQQAYARTQMLNYAANQTQSGHPMAVLALTDRLHVLQQFTSDPHVLATAIKNFKPSEQVFQPAAPPPASALSPDSGVHGGVALSNAIAAAQTEVASFQGLQVGQEIERRTLITIEAMNTLSRMLGGLQGRKTVVWVTGNLPFDLIPEDRAVSDAELLADLPHQGSERSVTVNGGGSYAAQQRALHAQEIRDAESRLASANIAIYPVDLHGLIGGSENLATASFAHSDDVNGAGMANAALAQSSVLVNSQGTLREVANETGGKAYMNLNEIKDGVALAAADGQATYEIGYYPENKKWDGKYRNIKVKLTRGDTDLRYRKGYFAIEPGPAKGRNFEQDVASALQVNAPSTQISFMAQAKPGDAGKIKVIFLVDAHTVSAEDSSEGKKMNVSLYAAIYDSAGKMIGNRRTDVNRSFDAATYQQIVEKGMLVPLDLDALPAGKELRLAVLDNRTGLIGTAKGPIGQ